MTVKELINVLKDYDEYAVIKLVCSIDEGISSCQGKLVSTLSNKDEVLLFADCN